MQQKQAQSDGKHNNKQWTVFLIYAQYTQMYATTDMQFLHICISGTERFRLVLVSICILSTC